MKSVMRYWYLHNQQPVHVLAEKVSENELWYLPELRINVDGSNLFRRPVGVLKSLRNKIDAEIDKRKNELLPGPTATKVKYLWLIEGGKQND